MKFLHISDTHYLIDNPGSLYGIDYDPNTILEQFLASHNFSPYEFIVHTGDVMSDGTVLDYQAFEDLMAKYIPADIPIYYIPGNHDKRSQFKEVFTPNYEGDKIFYKVEHGDYRLLFLDTLIEGQHDGELGDEQEQWFINELENDFGLGTLVFQHHPYEIGWKEEEIELTVSDSVKNAIAQSNVIGLFSGHLHQGQTSIVYGKPQFSANSLSFGISLRHDRFMRNNRLGYQIVDVREDLVKYYPEISYPNVTDYQEEVKVVDLIAGE